MRGLGTAVIVDEGAAQRRGERRRATRPPCHVPRGSSTGEHRRPVEQGVADPGRRVGEVADDPPRPVGELDDVDGVRRQPRGGGGNPTEPMR